MIELPTNSPQLSKLQNGEPPTAIDKSVPRNANTPTFHSSMAALIDETKEPSNGHHRNSVSSRDNLNNGKKSTSNASLSKKLDGTKQHASSSNLLKKPNLPGLPEQHAYKQSNLHPKDDLKEEQEGSKSAKGSPMLTKLPSTSHKDLSKDASDANNGAFKTRFLSFSKRLKGINNASNMELSSQSNNTKKKMQDPSKNMSTAKLTKDVVHGANLPSSSAYDISAASNHSRPKTLDDYYVIRRVGKGGFATVFLIRLKASTGRYFALKVIKKEEVVRLKQEKQIMNEKNILFELKHPLLVDLYHTFQSPSNLFMVLEFVAGGDLFSLLRKSKTFTEPQGKFYICEVITVLEYLHSMRVVYRDLKPENILLDSTGHIKLADFGFAKRLVTTTSSFCGTPDYIAAEIVASKPYTFTVDWWSLGVLIFELISGKTPFRADDSEGIYSNIQIGKIQWTSLIVGPIKTVVAELLTLDPKKRLGAKGAGEIKASAWFADVEWDKIGHRGVNPPVIPATAAPETLELEKVTKGIQSDYTDILGDTPNPPGKFGDPFDGVFKGF
ncbi:kinase-like domain-containing protein [Globomyces pollinis-pini]|nr:kinase-like domain-containing protein [Globomyces pollinis-pini]